MLKFSTRVGGLEVSEECQHSFYRGNSKVNIRGDCLPFKCESVDVEVFHSGRWVRGFRRMSTQFL
jgi:hypothetical protein